MFSGPGGVLPGKTVVKSRHVCSVWETWCLVTRSDQIAQTRTFRMTDRPRAAGDLGGEGWGFPPGMLRGQSTPGAGDKKVAENKLEVSPQLLPLGSPEDTDAQQVHR